MLTTNSAQQVAKLAGASVDRMAVNASLYEKNTGVTARSSLTQATASCVAALRKPVAKIERESGAMVSRIVDNDVVKTGVKRTSAFSQKRVAEAA